MENTINVPNTLRPLGIFAANYLPLKKEFKQQFCLSITLANCHVDDMEINLQDDASSMKNRGRASKEVFSPLIEILNFPNIDKALSGIKISVDNKQTSDQKEMTQFNLATKSHNFEVVKLSRLMSLSCINIKESSFPIVYLDLSRLGNNTSCWTPEIFILAGRYIFQGMSRGKHLIQQMTNIKKRLKLFLPKARVKPDDREYAVCIYAFAATILAELAPARSYTAAEESFAIENYFDVFLGNRTLLTADIYILASMKMMITAIHKAKIKSVCKIIVNKDVRIIINGRKGYRSPSFDKFILPYWQQFFTPSFEYV